MIGAPCYFRKHFRCTHLLLLIAFPYIKEIRDISRGTFKDEENKSIQEEDDKVTEHARNNCIQTFSFQLIHVSSRLKMIRPWKYPISER